MTDFSAILEKLRACKDSGNGSALPKLLMDLDVELIEDEELPGSFLDGICDLIQDPSYLALDESWNLVYFLNNHWEGLPVEKRERLRTCLLASFDKYHNWMGAFVIAEIFGERYADEDAIRALESLSKTASLPARAVVPHGFEHFIKTTTDEHLRDVARKQLQGLAQSGIKEVRDEAILSLRKVGEVRNVS